MSLRRAIGGAVRTLLIAGATAAATFGLLGVIPLFSVPEPVPLVTTAGDAPAAALMQRIADLRQTLREAEDITGTTEAAAPSPLAARRAELASLVEAYLEVPLTTITTRADPPGIDPTSLGRLLITGGAALAALLLQFLLTLRRQARGAPDAARPQQPLRQGS